MYYLQSRYYNPEIGRFISKDDPLFTEGQTGIKANAYAYCLNNPVMKVDPIGYAPSDYLPTNKFNLNTKEKILFDKNPAQGASILILAQTAFDMAQALYKSETLFQGNGDAFRHVFWNTLMSCIHGYDVAMKWSDAHEYGNPNNGGIDMEMDLKNNKIGANLGKKQKIERYGGVTINNCKNAAIKCVQDGLAWRIVNGQLKKTDKSGRK